MDDEVVYRNAWGVEKVRRVSLGRKWAAERMAWMRGNVKMLEETLIHLGARDLESIVVVGSVADEMCGFHSDIDLLLLAREESESGSEDLMVARSRMRSEGMFNDRLKQPFRLDLIPVEFGDVLEGNCWVWKCGQDGGEFEFVSSG